MGKSAILRSGVGGSTKGAAIGSGDPPSPESIDYRGFLVKKRRGRGDRRPEVSIEDLHNSPVDDWNNLQLRPPLDLALQRRGFTLADGHQYSLRF